MTRIRLVLATVLAIVLAGTGSLGVIAQEGTPVPQAPPLGNVAQPNGTLPGNPQIQLVKVADGLADPVNATNAADGSGRVFIVERVGRIRILDQGGNLLPDPFLDIRSLVKIDFLEQGLLGLAFHPEYETNGLFYVYYSDYLTNGRLFLSEYHVSADDPNKADPTSARVLFSLEDPYVNHNGGTIHFGPDNYLYIAIGDGGLAGDPYDNAQKVDTLLGKILRIDVDARDAGAYGIPADNPFAKTGHVIESSEASQMAQNGDYHPAARPEICNWGLRNPWEHAFDPQTGEYYVTDVGQNAWEEVNYFPAGRTCGANLGWDPNEGAHCYPPMQMSCDKIGTLPVAEYDHSQGDCSITGIGVYRGQTSPTLDGIYFNTDFCSGTVYGLVRDQDGTWVYQRLLSTALKATGAGQDEAGELYLAACECEFTRDYNPLDNPSGTLWRLVSADQVPQGAETAPTPAPEGSPVATLKGESQASAGQGQTRVTVTMADIAFQSNEITIAANVVLAGTVPRSPTAWGEIAWLRS
ncbi:MAG: hypothetical protein QOF73_161 [Thermomicrobiales bacterium]|nr:hypothetical protein [Thermomicrobiales bacterium]